MDETGASKYTGIEDFVFTTELVEKVIGRFSEGLEGKVETALARKEEVEIRGILEERCRHVFRHRRRSQFIVPRSSLMNLLGMTHRWTFRMKPTTSW